MNVVIRKVDMDTCLSGLLLGASRVASVTYRPSGATAEELADLKTACLEAGGSGDVAHANFDHHSPGTSLPPACVQVAQTLPIRDPKSVRLIEYVAAVDLGRQPTDSRPRFPTLSNLFSGMLLCIAEPIRQFREGMRLLEMVHSERIDPFGTMPNWPEFVPFVAAKCVARDGLAEDLTNAQLFRTALGATAGIIHTTAPGALGALYQRGCEYAVAAGGAFSPALESQQQKITIGGRDGARVDHLLRVLNRLEQGWGGPAHGTIIGSPATGTALEIERIVGVVAKAC